MTLEELREKAPTLALYLDAGSAMARGGREGAMAELTALIREARAAECEACLANYYQSGVGAAQFFRDRAERIRRGAL